MSKSPSGDLSEARRKVMYDVNTFGWHVMQVLGSPGIPGWSYSIGLFKTFQHPEVAIFGLDLQVMHQVLNIVGRSVQKGHKFSEGAETHELLENHGCIFRRASDVWVAPLFGFAKWFYGDETFPVYQVFWPDRKGNYPWQNGFDVSLVPFQPLLFESDLAAAGAAKLVARLK